MYNKLRPSKTTLIVNKGYEGESIEKKIARIINNKEPIKDSAPIIYTQRKDGVNPDYDIRHDKFETAIDLADKVSISHTHVRNFEIGERTIDTMTNEQKEAHFKKYPMSKHKPKDITGGESAQATDNK